TLQWNSHCNLHYSIATPTVATIYDSSTLAVSGKGMYSASFSGSYRWNGEATPVTLT
ncbi:hypothetical protein MKX03_018376, partial [Papaver bracteatum]